MSAYVIQQLTKVYQEGRAPANTDISFTIEQGDIFGIFGPNGAGKTTLVRQLMALLKPTSGSIHLFDHDIVQSPDIVPTYVGYYGQKVVALRNHTMREVLMITGILRGMPTGEASNQAQRLIDQFDLGAIMNRRLATISGGERRLAVLLGSLMGELPLLILDEPTNELDPTKRQDFWAYINHLNQTRGTTIVLTTHNLIEAEQVVERVAVINEGKLAAVGTPGQLKRQVAGLVRLEVRLRDGAFHEVEAKLSTLEASRRLRPGRWEITAPQDQAQVLLPRVIALVGFDVLDDFRLITPTMEDVFAKLTGRRLEEGVNGKS